MYFTRKNKQATLYIDKKFFEKKKKEKKKKRKAQDLNQTMIKGAQNDEVLETSENTLFLVAQQKDWRVVCYCL